ncbi:MAG: glucokinase [Gammaproteobacteria bacterium]|nr:glucokinase [Gammaproteobacteria bacterium]
MNCILAADIGGTKTLFQLSTEQGDVVLETEYVSQQYASFDLVLADFLAQDQVKEYRVSSACFAVAGPVSGRDANVTNLPWALNADALESQFSLQRVQLCNDFEAVAHGISCLSDDDVFTLQEGKEDMHAPRAIIGAGTGLGQALLFPNGDAWTVVATEGGHTDFAPTDRVQTVLLERLIERFGHVSYERVVSGAGLVTIYEFLRAYQQYDEDEALRQAMINADAASAISLFSSEHNEPLAVQALDLFIQIYGAQAGNLALTVSPRGGLYLAGGIAAKNLERFKQGGFMKAFQDKGRMKPLMEDIPVRIVLQPKVGLLGARLLARRFTV